MWVGKAVLSHTFAVVHCAKSHVWSCSCCVTKIAEAREPSSSAESKHRPYFSGFGQQECQSTGKRVNVLPLKGANNTDTKVDRRARMTIASTRRLDQPPCLLPTLHLIDDKDPNNFLSRSGSCSTAIHISKLDLRLCCARQKEKNSMDGWSRKKQGSPVRLSC